MSHSIGQFAGITVLTTVTIIDYTVGGESVPVNSFNYGNNNVIGVVLGQVPPSQNSLGVVLVPVLEGNKVLLFHFVSGSPVEIPTTVGLNAVVPAVIGFN